MILSNESITVIIVFISLAIVFSILIILCIKFNLLTKIINCCSKQRNSIKVVKLFLYQKKLYQ